VLQYYLGIPVYSGNFS